MGNILTGNKKKKRSLINQHRKHLNKHEQKQQIERVDRMMRKIEYVR